MLDKGVGQVAQAAPFEVDAAGLKIRGAGVRVGLGSPDKTVEIAALTGVAKVFGNGDVLLASIPAGRHMKLAFQAAQNGTLTRSGCLVYKDGHFILQDDDTQEVVELAGNPQDLSKNLGNRVEIKGTASAAKPAVTVATSVLTVTSVSPKSQGGCLVVASALNAQTRDARRGCRLPRAVRSTPAPAARRRRTVHGRQDRHHRRRIARGAEARLRPSCSRKARNPPARRQSRRGS